MVAPLIGAQGCRFFQKRHSLVRLTLLQPEIPQLEVALCIFRGKIHGRGTRCECLVQIAEGPACFALGKLILVLVRRQIRRFGVRRAHLIVTSNLLQAPP